MAQAHRELQPGEHVSWNYGAGQAKGQVVEKLTSNTKLGARVFKASPDDPKYLVKSDTSGKEAIKKPEALFKLDKAGKGDTPLKNAQASAESDAQKREVGAKEKRDGLKARSMKDEKKDVEGEETAKKVADTGKSSPRGSAVKEKSTKGKDVKSEPATKPADTGKTSVRASAKAAKTKLKQVAAELQEDLAEDVPEKRDSSYKPKEDELKAPDDEEAIATLPMDEDVLTQADREAKREGTVAVDKALEAEDYTEEDRSYEPQKGDAQKGEEPADDEAEIDKLEPDEKLLEQAEKENKEAEAAADAGEEEVIEVDTGKIVEQGGAATKK